MSATSSKCSLGHRVKALFCAAVLVALLASSGCDSKEPVNATVAKGEPAPNFTFIDLATEKTKRLSDLKGKVVVIDFWASWCVPCQETMAEMQTYREKHPDWGDSVVLLAASVDYTERAAKDHLEKKGWNQTQNAWIDPKGGKNPDYIAYAGQGIPAGYIIGPNGVLFDSYVGLEDSAKMDVAGAVKRLLPSVKP